MKKRICVTRKDIKEGVPCDPKRCPVARGLKRHLKYDIGVTFISFGRHIQPAYRIYNPHMPDSERLHPLPMKIHQFIRDFDTHQPVKPFTFLLDLPNA